MTTVPNSRDTDDAQALWRGGLFGKLGRRPWDFLSVKRTYYIYDSEMNTDHYNFDLFFTMFVLAAAIYLTLKYLLFILYSDNVNIPSDDSLNCSQ